jgi:hypothetical protein
MGVGNGNGDYYTGDGGALMPRYPNTGFRQELINFVSLVAFCLFGVNLLFLCSTGVLLLSWSAGACLSVPGPAFA